MSYAPFVSIIIPTYHDWDRLSKCLKALENQTYPSDRFEVIVVNNDPQDAVPEHYSLPRNFKVVYEAEPGSYAARNTGVALAQGDILGFTDSDCISYPNWIETAVNYFEKNPNFDRLGGKVELFIAGHKHTLAEAYETVYAFRQEQNTSIGISVTANMFTKKKVFDEVGLFNSTMFSGGDFEWGVRAASRKYKIGFSPDVVVRHPARRDLKQLINKIKRVAAGKLNIYPEKSSLLEMLLYFVYEFRPPVKEFRQIYERGRHLSFELKVKVFFLRYRIRILRAYEQIKVYNGAKPFKDNAVA